MSTAPVLPRPGVPAGAAVSLLADPGRLSELVGEPVRPGRLRLKPGTSASASLLDPGSGIPVGWARLVPAGDPAKSRNAVRRASRLGLRVRVREVRGVGEAPVLLLTGPVAADPRLHRAITRLAEVVGRPALRRLGPAVVRYNPHRRLVLRHCSDADAADVALRLTADPQRQLARLHRSLARAGVPVLEPLAGPGPAWSGSPSRWLTAWPWHGTSDLLGATAAVREPAARAAGAALARLHRVPSQLLRDDPGTCLLPEESGVLVDDLAAVDAGLGARAAALGEAVRLRLLEPDARAAAGSPVLVHGDFSPDQVVLDEPAAHSGPAGLDVRLIDLDHWAIGHAPQDLASFAAVELLGTGGPGTGLPLTAALLAGYRRAGGEAPDDPAALGPWTARALLDRVTEPLRRACPDWADQVAARLDLVEEVLR